ncbi:MAG: hypothetical protein IPM61_15135 [Chlorobi bacterium]|nr:hypothetical protein [Chlorobiota bacterium]
MLNRSATLTSVLLLAAIAAGCGGESTEKKTPDAPLLKFDPATAGTISGTVIFQGTPPPPTPADMGADEACHTSQPQDPRLTDDVVVNGGKLANAFIYISEGVSGRYQPAADSVVLNQHGCRYDPHVFGIMVGQKLVIKNSDPTLHNVHSMGSKNKQFNLAQYGTDRGKVQTDIKEFDHEEIMVPVSCDVHGWMRSYAGVLNHPFYAVSGSDGSFSFKAPPGTYTLTAWHERLGKQTAQVTIASGESKPVSFTFTMH